MFGYAPTLTPEASQVVVHLVTQVGLNNTVPAHRVSEDLGMEEAFVLDAIEELRGRRVIAVHGPRGRATSHAEPKASAWLYLPPGTLDYDLQEDMLAVARSVAERETATPQEIEEDVALSPGRLSIAAECLQYEGKLRVVKFHGRSEYGFNEASATVDTLRFVRSNEP